MKTRTGAGCYLNTSTYLSDITIDLYTLALHTIPNNLRRGRENAVTHKAKVADFGDNTDEIFIMVPSCPLTCTSPRWTAFLLSHSYVS